MILKVVKYGFKEVRTTFLQKVTMKDERFSRDTALLRELFKQCNTI